MKYLENLSDWLEKHYGKKTRLEDQFLDVVARGISSGVDEVSKKWINLVMFKCAIVEDILGGTKNRRDNLIQELEYRIVDGEDPKKVMDDIYKKLPRTTKKIDDLVINI